MAMFLYFGIFLLFTPVLAFTIWLIIKRQKRIDAAEEAAEDLQRAKKIKEIEAQKDVS